MASTDLSMYRGDDKNIDLVITRNGSVSYNITNGSVFMTIKPAFTATGDTTAIGSWIVTTHTYAASGMTTIPILNSQSDGWTPGVYWYDVQLKSGTTINTLTRGRFTVLDDVTRRTT